MVLDIFGGRPNAPPPPGGRRWLLQSRVAGRQRVPRSLLLPRHGGWQQAPASWRTAPTPPLPLGRQPPLLDPGARQRAFRPTWSSIVPAPRLGQPLAVSASPCCPTSSAPRSPQQRGLLLTACPSFLPGFGTNVTKFVDREEGGGNRRTFKQL